MSDLTNAMDHASCLGLAGATVPIPAMPAPSDSPAIETIAPHVHARFGVIASLYVALRAKYPPAAAHSLRVAYWVSAWGIKHHLPEDRLFLFETLALLHDVGKIGIPDRLLQKPDRLFEHEQSMLDMHPQIGVEILQAAGASDQLLAALSWVGKPCSLIVPDGGNDTRGDSPSEESASNPLFMAAQAARLVNIIDAFDEKANLPNQQKLSAREIALAEIIGYSGSLYDRDLAKSFVELVLTCDDDLKAQVSERWINRIEQNDISRYFDVEHTRSLERVGSSLVQSLNETFYRHMMDHVQNGLIFIDSEYRILDWNSAAETLTGRAAQPLLHQRWSPATAGLCDVDGYPLNDTQCPFRALIINGVSGKQRLSIRTSDGNFTQVSADVVPVISDRGQLCGGAMIIEDVSETAELEQKIIHLRQKACIDQLTGLANRGELNRQLEEFLDYHQRTHEPASVIICDIDFFKKINDTFSHQAGDEALTVFATLLKETCRDTDFVARFGGEEFVILCGQCDLQDAKKMAEGIRVRLQRTPIASLRNQCLTASFGVATVQPEDSTETLLGRADRGLLIAKESGRDRVVALGASDTPSQEPADAPKRSWLGKLLSAPEKGLHADLITSVPRAVTLEKLKGFVHEIQATVQHADPNNLVLVIDCKHAPIPKLKDERLSKFRMAIEISDVEIQVSNNSENIKVCTLLEVDIQSIKTRDRRTDALRSQANRLKTALQGYVVAHEMDEEIEKTIIRKFKASGDSRY